MPKVLKVPTVLRVLVLMVPIVLKVLVLMVVAPRMLTAQVEAQRPDGVIIGRVVDGVTGKPVVAAVVSIDGPQFLTLPAAQKPARVLTGADGRFVFRGLDAGTVDVTATKGGYAEGEPGRWSSRRRCTRADVDGRRDDRGCHSADVAIRCRDRHRR